MAGLLLPPSRPDEVERPEPGYLLDLAYVIFLNSAHRNGCDGQG